MFGWLKVCYYRSRLRHRNVYVAQSAVEALAKLGAVDGVRQAVHHDSERVAGKAVEALAKLGAVDGVMQAVHHDSDCIARSAVEALAELGAVDGLIQALDHHSEFVARKAVEALAELGAVNELMQALDHPRAQTQRVAALKLAESGVADPRIVKPLITDLRHATSDDWSYEPHIVEGVARALGRLGDSSAVGPLLSALSSGLRHHDSGEGQDLSAIAGALRELNDPEALREASHTLSSVLVQRGVWGRHAVARALAELGHEKAIPFLLRATDHHEHVHLRAHAAAALFRLGDPRGSKILGETVDDILGRHGALEDDIVNALDDNGKSRAADICMHRLEGACELATIETLGKLGDPRAVNPLVDLLKKTCKRRPPIGRRSIRGQINHAAHRSHTREAIVRALVRLADAESCVFLLSEKWKEIISYANAPHTDRPHDDEAPHTTDCGAYTDSHEDLGAGFALPPTPSTLSHEKVDLDF